MELTPDIRARLKTLLEERGETGYSLNQKLSISATTISNYLNGKITKADNTKIKAICELLGKDISWLETGMDSIAETLDTNKEVESSETLLKQLLLRLSSKDDQFTNLRQDLYHIQNDLNIIKKELSHLKNEIAYPKQRPNK